MTKIICLSGETVFFDSEKHAYYLESGEILKSVTEVLKSNGYISTKYMSEDAAIRGSRVHLAIEQMNNGERSLNDFSSSRIYPYLEAYYWFLIDTGFKPDLVEKTVIDPDSKIAGTLDITGTIENANVLIDIKTGIPCDWHPIQLAAYAKLAQKETYHRYTLHLNAGTTYRLKDTHRRLGDYNNTKWVDIWNRIVEASGE